VAQKTRALENAPRLNGWPPRSECARQGNSPKRGKTKERRRLGRRQHAEWRQVGRISRRLDFIASQARLSAPFMRRNFQKLNVIQNNQS
jgi:hypothetical protein